jgi:TATA-binding protein-associated factor Taf7
VNQQLLRGNRKIKRYINRINPILKKRFLVYMKKLSNLAEAEGVQVEEEEMSLDESHS